MFVPAPSGRGLAAGQGSDPCPPIPLLSRAGRDDPLKGVARSGALVTPVLRIPTLAVVVALVTAIALPAIAPGGGPPTASTAGGDLAESPGQPDCQMTTIVDNDEARVKFHGMKAMFHVWSKDEAGTAEGKYLYKTKAIREEDAENTTVAWVNLENAQPLSSTCEITTEDEWVNVTYTATEDVRAAGDGAHDGGQLGQAVIEFRYHFNTSDNSAKFDLNVQDWPWQGDGTLAYDFTVSSDWTIEPAENGLGFRGDDGETKAFVQWAPNATAYYEDGHNETAVVDSATTVDEGEDGGNAAFVTLNFTQASPGYVELDYDPTVGAGSYLIIAGILMVTDTTLPLPERINDLVWAAL